MYSFFFKKCCSTHNLKTTWFCQSCIPPQRGFVVLDKFGMEGFVLLVNVLKTLLLEGMISRYMLGETLKIFQIWLPSSFMWWNLWNSQAIESPAYCSYIPLVSILLEWCDRCSHEVWLNWGLLTTPAGRPDSTKCGTSYVNK